MGLATRVVAAAMAVMMLGVVGCGGSGADDADAARPGPLPVTADDVAMVDALRALPFGAANVSIVVDLLARSGVGVYPDDAADGAEPVRLTEWQVSNLAVEAANGGGVAGHLLGELAPLPEGAPPISYLLAAWAMSHPSPAAGFARALMGEQDWHHAEQVVFPKLLLTLFLADALASGPGGGQAAGAPGSPPQPPPIALRLASMSGAAAAGPCSAASSFIQNAIASVADALKVDTSGGGILGFLGTIWNFAVDLAAGVVRGLVRVFQDLVVGVLIDAFAVLAVIQEVYSYVVEWRADLVPSPEENRFGIDGEVVTGIVELQVIDNQLPVPDLVRDCAQVFNVDFTRLGSAEGSAVDWDFTIPSVFRADLATPLRKDAVLDGQRSARFEYQTGQEPAELAATGDPRADLFRVKATVHRSDVAKISDLLASLVLDNLPPAIAGVVRSLAQPLLNAVTTRLTELIDPKATELVTVHFHAPAEPTDAPRQTDTGLGADPNPMPDVCDLVTDDEIARVLGFPVGYVHSTRETRETAIAAGLPVSPGFLWSDECEKSTAEFEGYWATPPGARSGWIPPWALWTVVTHTASSDARDTLDRYRPLGGYTPVDGIGDEAMVGQDLVARVGNYFIYVDGHQEGYGLPFSPEQLTQIGLIIVGRL